MKTTTALEALKKDKPYLFGTTKPTAMAQKLGGGSLPDPIEEQMRSAIWGGKPPTK